MSHSIFIGTASGLWNLRDDLLDPVEPFTARTVTAMARGVGETWALVDGRALWRRTGTGWTEHAALGDRRATCVAATSNGVLVGTEEAHLLRVVDGSPQTVESFETAEGRDAWHTPWGDPAAVRSIAVGLDGTIYVNVHVGGVVRSRDGGRSWTPTVDIEADVHQVLAHPRHRDVVMVAAYDGFGISRDAGETWEFVTRGMHAHYARALAIAGDTVLVSASTGPRGRRATVYGKPLDARTDFVRPADSLPWFDHNVDTGCLAAEGSLAVLGTSDGRVFRSHDAGRHWSLVTKGLPEITAVAMA